MKLMSIASCVPVIPSADIEKTLRLWVDCLGFTRDSEMRHEGKLIGCMVRGEGMAFWLNQRAGSPIKPENYEGIRLYWMPSDFHALCGRLQQLGFIVSDVQERDYGQTEFFLTDEDGFSHCFGMATPK
jgi:uncharacterized glyoxalase superfamily protein PhnB